MICHESRNGNYINVLRWLCMSPLEVYFYTLLLGKLLDRYTILCALFEQLLACQKY